MSKDNALTTFLVFGVIILVALICFTVLAAIGARDTGVMRDVLLGLTSGLVGAYAVVRHVDKRKGDE
jgi:uncharacterized protein YycO